MERQLSFHEYRWPWVAAAGFFLFLIPFRSKGFASIGSATRFWLSWLLVAVVLGVSTAGTLTRGQWNSNVLSQHWAQAHWQIEFWLWLVLPLVLGLALDAAKSFKDWSGARKGMVLGFALAPLASRALPWEAWLALAPIVLTLGAISALLGRWLGSGRSPLWPFRGLIALNFAFMMQGFLDPPSPVLAALLFFSLAWAYNPATLRWAFVAGSMAWAAAFARDHTAWWPLSWWPPLAPMLAMALGWVLPLILTRREHAS